MNSKCFGMTYKYRGEGYTLIDKYRRRPVRSLLDVFYQLLQLFCVCERIIMYNDLSLRTEEGNLL